MKLLIVGAGYLGYHVFKNLRGHCEQIWGTVRKEDTRLLDSDMIAFDADSPIESSIIEQATHILETIPPVNGQDLLLSRHRQQLIQSKNLKWLGYCSTTGVYGNKAGAWVDETSLCLPSQMRSIVRKNVEDQWRELCRLYEMPVHIFRLSGIYGPGRSQVQSVLHGQALRINKPGQVFSRIHVEDITAVFMASMNHPMAGEIYNLADDFPCSSNEIIEYICEKLNLPLPIERSLDSDDISDILRSFYAECRRINNNKIKTKLGIVLKYPTYREGLANEFLQLKEPKFTGH